jgi:ring-1,2-phenylacetyl-CoA epoxidase subunit PaaE
MSIPIWRFRSKTPSSTTDGEVRMRRNYALEPEELASGYVLTCQALPVTDRVTVDYDA